MLVAFNRFADESRSAKIQLRRPSHAHARYSNDREFSTRQHAGKLPSVLKGNRKRIGKKAAHGKLANRESAIECAREPHATRKRRPTRGQPANHAALHQNRDRPANRKARPPNCGRPTSPSPLPTSTPSRKSALRKRKPPDIMAHRAAKRRGGGFRHVRERPNAAATQHVRQESHLQNGRRGCSGARGAAFPHRARTHRHELPYFETIRAQRHSRGVPCVRSA